MNHLYPIGTGHQVGHTHCRASVYSIHLIHVVGHLLNVIVGIFSIKLFMSFPSGPSSSIGALFWLSATIGFPTVSATSIAYIWPLKGQTDVLAVVFVCVRMVEQWLKQRLVQRLR